MIIVKKRRIATEDDRFKSVELRREEKTGVVAALFLFQYSLLIPLMRLISSSLLIAGSGILLLVATYFINRRVILNLKTTLVIILLTLLMFLKVPIDGTEITVILNFLLISVPPIVFYSYRFDTKTFLDTCYALSYLNFIELVAMPFLSRKVSYMRFGNGMVLTSIFMYLLIFRNKEGEKERIGKFRYIINLIVFAVSSLEVTLYGNRGALVILVSFIAIDAIIIHKEHVIRNFFVILAGFVAAFNFEHIINLLANISSRFNAFSYAIRKYQYQLQVGLVGASSGRSRLYQVALNEIKENPILGNRMIVYGEDATYVHNLFLQVGRDLGIIALFALIAFVIYCIYLLLSKKVTLSQKTIIAVFFCMSVIRLLLSSNVWERPEFWAFLCIALNYRTLLRENYNPLEDK